VNGPVRRPWRIALAVAPVTILGLGVAAWDGPAGVALNAVATSSSAVCAVPACPFSGRRASLSFGAPEEPAHEVPTSKTTIVEAANLTSPQLGNVTCNSQLGPGTYRNVTAQAGCVINSADLITGNVAVVRGGALYDLGAPIRGNLKANNSAWIELGGGTIGGNLQVTGLTSKPGAGPADIDGNNYLCSTKVGGDVHVQNNGSGAPIDIGAAPDCTSGLSAGGNLQVQNNAAEVIVGSSTPSVVSNTAKGNIKVDNNRGGGLLVDNIAGGNCKLQNNQPGITGYGNTVAAGHRNSCNTLTGTLVITITNLPPSLAANVVVTDPSGTNQLLTGSRTISGAAAGVWTVTANPVADPAASDTYFPTTETTTVSLAPGASGAVQIAYDEVVNNTTRVVASSALQSVTPPDVNGNQSLVITDPNHLIAPGDVLAIGVGPLAPEGLLLDVTDVAPQAGGNEDVTSTQGDLTDIGPQGDIVADESFTDPHSFDDPLTCNGGISASVIGSVDFSAHVDLEAHWGGPLQPKTITALATMSGIETASLDAKIEGQASCTFDTQLLPTPIVLPFIKVQVGPVPVIVVPKLNFELQADASVDGTVETSVSQTLTATVGLSWNGSTLSPISSLTNSFTNVPPTPSANGTLHAQVGPVLTFDLWDVAGPHISADAHTDFSADSTATPLWELTGGFEAGGGLKFKVWKTDFDKEDPDIISQDWLIAEANNSPLAIETTTLKPAVQGQPYSQTLVATGGTLPYLWILQVQTNSLPAGLTFDAATATISGTPTDPASSATPIYVTVYDAGDQVAFTQYTLMVASQCSPNCPVTAVADGGGEVTVSWPDCGCASLGTVYTLQFYDYNYRQWGNVLLIPTCLVSSPTQCIPTPTSITVGLTLDGMAIDVGHTYTFTVALPGASGYMESSLVTVT
jgi:hypothetical protein